MEVGNLGALYVDDSRFAASSLGIGKKALEGGEGGGPTFAELVKKSYTVDKTGALYEQCQELETFLVKTLINGMRSTVQKSGFIDEGFAGKMYEDMLYDEYARDFAKNANFGLAELAYLELTGQRGKLIATHA
jgi:Rod binding domain-containing protein